MKRTTLLKLITISIPVVFLILLVFKDFIFNLIFQLPPCPVYSFFELYCPACGNTRSVNALFHGDLAGAIRYNIIPVIVLLLCLLAYIELAAYSFGKRLLLLPRKFSFYLTLIIILLIYAVGRNFFPYLTP